MWSLRCGKVADIPMYRTLPGRFEVDQRLDRAIVFERLRQGRAVELHHVEMVGLHALEALLDARRNVFPGEDMRAALAARRRCRPDQASAFAGEEILVAAMTDVAADALLAQSIVDRGVDVVDPGVEHRVEDGFSLILADVAAARCAAQPHCPITEHR